MSLLERARDRRGQTPAEWLAGAVPPDPPGPVTRIDPLSVPLPHDNKALGSALLEMWPPSADGLDGLFGELRRVLRPTGTLVALVPSRPRFSPDWWSVHRAAGGRPRFRNESASDRLGWLFTAADFAVLLDQRRVFRLPLADASGVVDDLVASGFWPPDVAPERLAGAAGAFARLAGPDRSLAVPLRLVVGRR